jgi:beta-lactamase regulating signal transducer with metallopeptidase domain
MNLLEVLFDWFASMTLRGSCLAIAVVLLQTALRQRLPAFWNYALWLPVIVVLAAPVLPRTPLSLESRFQQTARPLLQTPEQSTAWLSRGSSASAATADPVRPATNWKRLATMVWLTGAGTTLLVGLAAYRMATGRMWRTAIPADRELEIELAQAAQACGLTSIPKILISGQTQSPAVTGFFRPLLLLPAGFANQFNRQERHLILLHELTHLKRADLVVNWLLFVVQCLHWCNPLIWIAFARLRADRETACDSAVLATATGDDRSVYGHALLKLESGGNKTPWSLCFVGMFKRGATLRSRIQAIATYRREHPGWAIPAILLIFALGAAATRAQSEGSPTAAAGVQVRVDARFLEVPSETKLEISGERAEFRTTNGDGVFLQDPAEATALFDRLAKQPGVDQLSAPAIITKSGEHASVWIGQEVKGAGQDVAQVGLKLEILPVVAESSVKLTLKVTITSMVDPLTGEAVGADPGDRTGELVETKLETTIAVKPGQSVTLSKGSTNPKIKSARRLVVSVTPRVMRGTREKLQSMTLPKLELNDVTSSDAWAILQAKIRELDPAGSEIKFVVDPPPAGAPKITLSLTQAPVSEALDYVARLAGLSVTYGDDSVILGPAPQPVTVVTHPPLPDNGKKWPPQEMAERLILPGIEFHEASLPEVVTYLVAASKELDPAKSGVPILQDPQAGKDVKITLTLANISVAEALRYVADLAGAKLRYESYAVTLRAD